MHDKINCKLHYKKKNKKTKKQILDSLKLYRNAEKPSEINSRRFKTVQYIMSLNEFLDKTVQTICIYIFLFRLFFILIFFHINLFIDGMILFKKKKKGLNDSYAGRR
jgi:hypothetical protein